MKRVAEERKGARELEIDEIIERVEALCAEISREGVDVGREAERVASQNVTAHRRAENTLVDVEERIEELRGELEMLPVEHSRATLADDFEQEVAVKDRYQVVQAEIAELEERRAELVQEIADLVGSNPKGHPRDVEINQYRRVVRAYSDPQRPLQRLQKGIDSAVSAAIKPLAGQHARTLGERKMWQEEVRFDQARERGLGG